MPWPARRNPHGEAARVHNAAWARTIGITAPGPGPIAGARWSADHLDTADRAGFCAWVHPRASQPVLELLTDWHTWMAFLEQDLLARHLRSRDPAAARAELARLRALMPTGDERQPPAPRGTVERGLADLWSRTVALASPGWCRRFADHTGRLDEELSWRRANARCGRTANPIEHVTMRRTRARAAWAVALVELAAGGEVAPELLRTRPLRLARDAFVDVVGLYDDLGVDVDGGPMAGLAVFSSFLGGDEQAALRTNARLIGDRLDEYEHTLSTELEPLLVAHPDPSQRARVGAFLRGLEEWIAGQRAWLAETAPPRRPARPGTRAGAPPSVGERRDAFDVPEIYMPFRAVGNPETERARASAKAWARRMGLLDGGVWDEASYDATDVVLLATLTHPDARGADLDLICQWNLWGFFGDDALLAAARPGGRRGRYDLVAARAIVERQRLMMAPHGGPSATPSTPLERALADLWGRTAPPLTAHARRRFAADVDEILATHLWEFSNAVAGRLPETIDYIEMRRRTVGARFSIGLGRVCREGAAPLADDIAQARPVRELTAIYADWIGLYNDLVSFQRERDGEDANSAPRVFASLLGCDLPGAAAAVNELVTARVRQFEHIVAHELEPWCVERRLDAGERADVRRYVTELEQWMAGAFVWAARTQRYGADRRAGATPRPARTVGRGPQILAHGASWLERGVRDAIETLPATTRLVAGYHLGWCDADGRPTPRAGGGKALRPTLVLLAAQACGARADDALPAAIAVELVHNFSLLHDDVMDGDVVRRRRATAWTVFGVGPAILAGDALLTVAFDVLARSGHARALDTIGLLSATSLRLIDGQNADLAFEARDDDVALSDCMTMATAKTGALLGCACALGGLVACAPDERVALLRLAGEDLGTAFQLVDDLLGIWGDPSATGKPVHADLARRKKSLPVVAALHSDTAAGRELADLYRSRGEVTAGELDRMGMLVERAGGRAWAEAEAARCRARGLARLDEAGLAGRAADDLRELAELVTSRDR